MSVCSFQAYAQWKFIPSEEIDHTVLEDGNKAPDGHFIRGAYLTNQWYDNWSFGVSAGLQTLSSKQNTGIRVTPAIDLGVTKWFTPSIAFRAGFRGLDLQENHPGTVFNHYQLKNVNGINYFHLTDFHLDMMWSATNAIGGYKESRFGNVIPYATASYLRFIHPDYGFVNPVQRDENGDPIVKNGITQYMRDREIGFGFGVLGTFRLTHNISATIDLRDTKVSGRYHDYSNGGPSDIYSLTFGLAYTIHKWYWERQTTSIAPLKTEANEAKEALAEAEAKTKALENKNEDLQIKVNALVTYVEDLKESAEQGLKSNPRDELLLRLAESDCILYYDINVDKLSSTESIRLDSYVRKMCEIDPKHVFYITGSADEGTGNVNINSRLSKARAAGVKNILMRKYGVPESQIVIKATVISSEHEDGRLDRCVFFENE